MPSKHEYKTSFGVIRTKRIFSLFLCAACLLASLIMHIPVSELHAQRHLSMSLNSQRFLQIILLRMREVCYCRKNICRRGRTRILTDSARKRIRKEVLANYDKTRIIIGHQHDRWMIWRKRWEIWLISLFGECFVLILFYAAYKLISKCLFFCIFWKVSMSSEFHQL
jgi:hypothetical protein